MLGRERRRRNIRIGVLGAGDGQICRRNVTSCNTEREGALFETRSGEHGCSSEKIHEHGFDVGWNFRGVLQTLSKRFNAAWAHDISDRRNGGGAAQVLEME